MPVPHSSLTRNSSHSSTATAPLPPRYRLSRLDQRCEQSRLRPAQSRELTAPPGPAPIQLCTVGHKLRTCCPVNCAINTPTTQQCLIGGINHDRYVECRDVSDHHVDQGKILVGNIKTNVKSLTASKCNTHVGRSMRITMGSSSVRARLYTRRLNDTICFRGCQ